MLRDRLLQLPRPQKRLLQVTVDVILIWVAIWLAFVVRLGSDYDQVLRPLGGHAWLFISAPLIAIPLFVRMGLYRAVMRYFGSDALVTIFKAATVSALLLALLIYWRKDEPLVIPRSLVINYWLISLALIGGLRLALRQYLLGKGLLALPLSSANLIETSAPRVAVYGAGAAGNQAVAALRMSQQMRPVAFIDDDRNLRGSLISGLQVYGPDQIGELIRRSGAKEILLAMPSVPRSRRREILEALEAFPIHVRNVPAFHDLACGRIKVEDLQEVDIADLLGRDAVPPQSELLDRCIRGRSVMVTGAGGSIGSELCRQILNNGAQVLVLYEQCEFNLYRIHDELEQRIARAALPVRVVPVLGSVLNQARLLEALREWRVETVYHAAAYKHVPLVEANVSEGILNNVSGTQRAALAALQAGVSHFVLISTDKAVRPANVMGASKRLTEMILQALSQEAAPALNTRSPAVNQINKTCFSIVRFGNVLGSSGSVIPRFREQIRNGGPITVTHPNITRYFMTIPEAAQLVIQAGALANGGEVFVLDMGNPVRIADLARKMVHLSGLSVRDETSPTGDIAIEFTGLRPGEKLYEELLINGSAIPTQHSMISRATEEYRPWDQLRPALERLELAALHGQQEPELRAQLTELIVFQGERTSTTPLSQTQIL